MAIKPHRDFFNNCFHIKSKKKDYLKPVTIAGVGGRGCTRTGFR